MKSHVLKNKIKKILVPLDSSKNSLRGLDVAIMIARPHESMITGFHVVPSSFPYGVRVTKKIREESRKKADLIVKEGKKKSNQNGILYKSKIQLGNNIGNEIVRYAHTNKYDIIVIGSKGPDPHLDMFLGSVSNFVIIRARIPVVIVK